MAEAMPFPKDARGWIEDDTHPAPVKTSKAARNAGRLAEPDPLELVLERQLHQPGLVREDG